MLNIIICFYFRYSFHTLADLNEKMVSFIESYVNKYIYTEVVS